MGSYRPISSGRDPGRYRDESRSLSPGPRRNGHERYSPPPRRSISSSPGWKRDDARRSYSPPARGRSPPRRRSESRPNRRGDRRRSRSRSRSRGGGRGGKGKGGGGGGGGGGKFCCFDWLRKTCQLGDRCPQPHPDREECKRIKDILASQPCKKGSQCPRPDCLYKHPDDHRRKKDRSMSRSRSSSLPIVVLTKAVGLKSYGDVSVIEDLKVPKPELDPKSKDVLVRMRASDMNLLDLKMREGSLNKELSRGGHRILGYSSAGVVEEMSFEAGACGRFKKGDGVWFANSWDPARGSNQEYVLVDYRAVSLKPKVLTYEDAASIPSVALTAWGAMFDRMTMDLHLFHNTLRSVRFTSENKGVFLALPGSSAAGSFALQLASKHFNKNNNLTIVAAASRSESETWCLRMGADHVINHNAASIKDELDKIGVKGVDYAFYSSSSRDHEPKLYAAMNPMGQVVFYDETNFLLMKDPFPKQISIHRQCTSEPRKNPEADGAVLTKVAQMFDDPSVGLQTMANKKFPELSAKYVRQAHNELSLALTSDDDALGKAVFEIE